MTTPNDIQIAIQVIKEFAGDPSVGAVKDLIDLLEVSGTATKEARIVTAKETR